MIAARSILVRGVVQGVGFRPFVFRLASANTLSGWVLNDAEGVQIHLEGAEPALDKFVRDLRQQPPPASRITAIEVTSAEPAGWKEFLIRESVNQQRATTTISPDLPVCSDCLREMFDPTEPRYHYPYINCTNCGPRYSILLALPYDRVNTTMNEFPMDRFCADQYHDPSDRRFHAQPVACPSCGPHYALRTRNSVLVSDASVIRRAAQMLHEGSILAVKGLGGYHLACDAANSGAVAKLRERKFRKEKPFALMAKDLATAREIVELSSDAEVLIASPARPIVLAPARTRLNGVAPESDELGVMLPYTPLHHLLFAEGAPNVLVMTSANRSNEPIAYEDDDAIERLGDLCDAFLTGERRIARRVDDSIARAGVFGPAILRRARGYAPGAVARLPILRPLLAVGADLKNAITLVVDGQAFVSQHIGDLDHYPALQAFHQTIDDLLSMYRISYNDLLVVHDGHPQYLSTSHALSLPAAAHHAVQHHRAHIASVLAERELWDTRVIGISFDGTGYGDDGTIWGGEIFTGSVAGGFERVAHLRQALLPGGDAAAREPVQAAAGFLDGVDGLPDLSAAPFHFPERYMLSRHLVQRRLRTFPTTSAGRLFDTAAALLGFTRSITFEGQAAMWLQHLANQHAGKLPDLRATAGDSLDYVPLLRAMAEQRVQGRNPATIARAFHRCIAQALADTVHRLAKSEGLDTVVLSGGVFQNELLLHDLRDLLTPFKILTNRIVPANDGGISLGQAALATFSEAAHA